LFAKSEPRIVIVGAGILGSSIALHLARRGARVTVCEKDRPASGATSRSFAWLNSTFEKQPFNYDLLNRLGMMGYHRLQQELGGALPLQWCGSLEWYGDKKGADTLRAGVTLKQSWGYTTRIVAESDLHRLEPTLRPGPVLAAAFSEDEGTVNPSLTTEAFLRAAQSAGATITYPCEITALGIKGGRLRSVQTTRGDLPADVLIVAAGVDTPRIAAMAGTQVFLIKAPGILVHTKPMPPLLSKIINAPNQSNMKQYPDGRMVIGDLIGPPPTHQSLLQGPPQDFPDDSFRELHAKRILKEAAEYLPGVASAQVERVTLGWRPLPKDGYPVLGFTRACPNVYVAVTHSGITLAPIIGQLVTTEILDSVSVDLLRPYRPHRFEAKQ
jgi:glycine/D-amino acid oxidase-like deaminating enzyme